MIPAAHLRRVLPLLVLAGTGTAQASTSAWFGNDSGRPAALATIAWEGAGPIGEFKTANLANSFNPIGVAGDLRFLLGTRVTLGVGVAWNHFTSENNANIDAYAPRLLAHWYMTRARVQPYLGVGAGAVAVERQITNLSSKTVWGASVDPQLGLLISLIDELALDLHVRYSYTTVSTGSVHNYQWLAVGAGFGFY